jgi:putative ABC transport system permease protein
MLHLGKTLKTLRRSPGFTGVVILTLAVGIGANTVVFSVVDRTVLNPFPYPEPGRLVGVGTVFPRLNQELGFWEVLSPAEFRDIAEEGGTLEKVVAWDMGYREIAGATTPTSVFTAFWWGDALSTLAMAPAAGRGFLPEETQRGERVAVISHRLWEGRYGGDPSVVGTTILVNNNPHTVVGVLPPRTLIYGTDLWIPMPAGPEEYPRNRRQFQVLARVAEGRTLPEVNAELEGISRRVEAAFGQEFPEYEGWRLVASTWTDINVHTLRLAVFILMGAVGLVLLLVCANLANLLLARALKRHKEFAVRSALGAGGKRILAELLAESTVLGILGGLAGVGVSVLGIQGLLTVVDVMGLPLPAEPALNLRVLLFTGGISILTGLLFGLIPALQVARRDLLRSLQAEGRAWSGGRSRRRLQRVLVGVETAVALALLIGSGLLVNSFVRLQRVDPGFDPERTLTMRLTLPWEDYDMAAVTTFFEELRGRVEALPGVASASVASQFPPQVFLDRQFSVEGEVYAEGGTLPQAYLTLVSPGFFDSMGIPLLRGRALEDGDRMGAREVAVVNESAARRFFGGEDPIGRRFHLGGPDEEGDWIEVVGVVADTRNRGLDTRPQPEIYGSTLQVPGGNQFFLIARATGNPMGLLPSIRRSVADMDPDQPVYAIRTMDQALAASVAPKRIATVALSIFAAFALLLAAVGIYSVVAFDVTERTREIGLRMALGAEADSVIRLVVRQAMVPVGVGAVAGIGLAVLIQGFLQGLLFQISGTDPMTFLVVTALLLAVAVAASLFPAGRASGMDPVEALRDR